MEIHRHTAEGRATLVACGRLDAAWSGALGDALQQAVHDGFHDVHLEFSGVSYVSSAGIRVLMTHWKELRRVKGRLAIVAISPEVERTLRLAGLEALLEKAAEPAAQSSAKAHHHKASNLSWNGAGFTGEIEEQHPSARLRGRLTGQPLDKILAPPNLEAIGTAKIETVRVNAETLALGFGAFGDSGIESSSRLGELLAAGGSAVCLPTDGPNQPDYVVTQGDLAPEAQLASGLVATGQFARCGSFEASDGTATLGDLLAGLPEAAGSGQIAFACVAECAGLVGACLRKSPGAAGAANAYDFPNVREWLSFTPEPVHANTLALLAGVVTNGSVPALDGFTRPIGTKNGLRAHIHAASFPYRPVRHGRIDLAQTVAGLFDAERVLGVLHLLTDNRSLGAGDSRFYRGVCWFGPLDI